MGMLAEVYTMATEKAIELGMMAEAQEYLRLAEGWSKKVDEYDAAHS